MSADATPLDSAQDGLAVLRAVRSSRREGLTALRDFLAVQLELQPDKAPQIGAQLRATMAEMDALPTGDGMGVIDDLARQRERRHAAVGGSASEGDAPSADVLLNGG